MISPSNNLNKKKIVWVEKTGLIEIVVLLFERLFCNIKVYYDEHQITQSAGKVLKLIEKINALKIFYPANLSFAKKDDQGYSLTYQAQRNLNICLEGFCSKYIPDEPDWYKQMTKSYLSSCILNRIKFIVMVELKAIEYMDVQHELLLKRHPANPLIINFYKGGNFHIRQTVSINEYLKIMIKPVYYIIMTFLFQVVGGRIKSDITEPRPSIWVETFYGMLTNKHNMIFWRDYVSINEFDLVYYFDRPDTPLNKEFIKTIKERGNRYIDCSKIYKLSKLGVKNIFILLLLVFRVNVKQPFWFHFFKLQYAVLYRIYLSIYKKYQVKILFQHQEGEWRVAVQARAIEDAGGIMIGYHWSIFYWTTEPQLIAPQHVYFVWGNISYEWLQKNENTCKYILPSGIWVVRGNAPDVELSNFRNSMNFVLAIFDSGPWRYNSAISPIDQSVFYLRIIELLEKNSTWGGIVKSKRYELEDISSIPHGNEIYKKMKNLIDKRRLVFLDPSVSPVTASSYADLSVCATIQSAGILAAGFNNKVICHDLAGYLMFPIYKEPEQKIIYPSLADLEKAIFRASKGNQSIGASSRWQQKLNYFNDFKAPERVGHFIQNYMDNVLKTGDVMSSLDLTVKRYIHDNKIKGDFFAIKDLWGAV